MNAFVSGGAVPESRRGTTLDAKVTAWDLYATYAALAGADPTDHRAAAAGLPPIDSVDLWPLLSGANTSAPHAHIPLGTDDANRTVGGLIQGPWKLLLGTQLWGFWQGEQFPNASTPHTGTVGTLECGDGGCLFNIDDDPTEHHDVSQQHPDIVAQMRSVIDSYERGAFRPDRGSDNGQVGESIFIGGSSHTGHNWCP